MKNRLYALLFGAALGLSANGTALAMSTLVDMSMEPQWPTTPNPGTAIVYKLTTIDRVGQGLLEVTLSSAGLPEAVQVVFTPSVLRFTGRVPDTQTAIMTVTCPVVMPTDIYPFTVTGTSRRESVTITNQVTASMREITTRPPMLMLDWLQDGGSAIRGQGASGQAYQVESSPELTNPDWTFFGGCTADGNGRFTLPAISIDKTEPMRFFRAVCPAPAPAQ